MPEITPDRLKSLLSADAAEAAPGAATPPENPSGPLPSPMSTPEPKMGTKEGALVNLSMALDLIEQAIVGLGSESDEGKMAQAAMRALSKILGAKKPRTDELQPAEIMQLLGQLPQAGNVTPEVAAAMGKGGPKGPAAPPAPPAGAPPAPPMAA